jgi:hypothetical protein
MKKLRFCILVILLLALSGCSNKEQWEGYVFPNKDNLLIHRNSGRFQSLQECKDASMAILESLDALEKGYYECGKNCKSGASHYNRGCEDSFRGNVYK